MIRINKDISREKLLELVVRASKKFVPYAEQEHGVYYPKNGSNYFYFSPSSHVRSGLITPKIINDLQNGANMLTVGSGDGSLEILLNKAFGVPKSRIEVSDIERDKGLAKAGFKYHIFDMTKKWPKFGKFFDYVIFPESLGVALLNSGLGTDKYTLRFHDTVKKVVENTKLNNFSAISDLDTKLFFDLMEQDAGECKTICNIIKQAFNLTKDKGEVRICNDFQSDHEKAYIKLRLIDERLPCEFPTEKTFLIRKLIYLQTREQT